MFFNTHTHLNSPELFDKRDILIQNALKEDVIEMTVVGYDVESSQKAVQIAHEYPFIHAAVGISPNDCEETTEKDMKIIEELADDEEVVAIGETGLDYHWDVDPDKQKDIFYKHLEICKKKNLPVIIHCRDAYEDTYNILSESEVKGIMHCYSGSDQMADRFIKLGYYISLAGPVTFKNAKMPKMVAKHVPIEKLLIETDDPYMAPTPLRGQENQPANVIYIAETIAKLKNIDVQTVATHTTQNAKDIFQL